MERWENSGGWKEIRFPKQSVRIMVALKDKSERTERDRETYESGERERDGVIWHTAVVECETDAAQWRVRGQWCL